MRKGFTCISVLILACAVCASALGAVVVPPKEYKGTPIEFGISDLNKALAGIKADVKVRVLVAGDTVNSAAAEAMQVLDTKPESFAISRAGKEIAIVGRDKVGAMYGCLELAERVDMKGALALDIKSPIAQSPAVEFRAVNPFITLPYSPPLRAGTASASDTPPTTGENDHTWWFLQESYWKGYLDQLGRARINWIDMHGMYDIKTTGFPNIYPYFMVSEKFPDVGVEPAVAERNLAMLNKVIHMAKLRGIRFALMSYSAGWGGAGLRKPISASTPENLAAYTREVVRKMIEQCPELEMIGFRIGESGQKETFYRDSYIPAIAEAGRSIDLYTRTWGAKRDQILLLGQEFPKRFFIEIKYNGEQFGPPYIVAGGRMQGWGHYSYQRYYSYPRAYQIIYQLRANGTHRVFPWGNPLWAARANEGSTLAGSIGLCTEPIDAYYPKYDYRHRDDSPNRWFKWQFERDWYWYQVWGRTAYDPSLGKRDDLWIRMFQKRFGKDAAPELYQAMNWASMIVPDAYTAYSLGPDHRNHAPEMEWGDDVKAWSKGQPFDMQNVMSPREYADGLIKGELSARATPLRMADYLAEEARKTTQYVELARKKMTNPTPEFNDLTTELMALSHLGDYYSHKFYAATMFALMVQTSDVSLEQPIRMELKAAAGAWGRLAKIGDEHYKPFVDKLRMHTEEYTWSEEGEKLPTDLKALDETVAGIKASGKTGQAPPLIVETDVEGPKVIRCDSAISSTTDSSAPRKLTVRVWFSGRPEAEKVFLKTKPFPSDRGNWVLAPMTKKGPEFVGEAEVDPDGLMWCIEAFDAQGAGTMWPDFRKETPYRIVEPWNPK